MNDPRIAMNNDNLTDEQVDTIKRAYIAICSLSIYGESMEDLRDSLESNFTWLKGTYNPRTQSQSCHPDMM